MLMHAMKSMHDVPTLLGVQASQMASKALQSEDLAEDEMQPAPKLLEVILQNCRGRVDHCLPLYVQARAAELDHIFPDSRPQHSQKHARHSWE